MLMRKRARKACVPCHQRKRKCDGEYPCDTCSSYGYNCNYADDDANGYPPPPAKRVSRVTDSGNSSQVEPSPQEAGASSTKNLTVGSDTSTALDGTTPAGIFDEHKSRYAGASAAMAFPHVLGRALGFDSLSKIHPLAYNFGIRPEEASSAHVLLGTLISEDELEFFSGVYFSALAPIGDILDPRIFAQRCRDYYHGSGSSMIAFSAVAAGVAALGSFLSPNRHTRESDLVQYAKAILDDPASLRTLGIDHIIAWSMRVFYLRATSLPNNAWIASCTMMHLCEAVGLHEDDNIKKMASVAGAAVVGHDADRLRRIFWIAWAGHNLLSYEYDRSAVQFRAVTCQAIIPTTGSVAHQFVQIAQIIPAPNSPFRLECHAATPRDELFGRLKALKKLQFTHPFLVVTKAELAFCFYRRIYQLKMGISDDMIKLITDSGNAAIDAAQQLANQGRLFWNVIGSVFQYTCVLLAMDTPAASIYIAAAFKGLENLVQAADTGPTREALSMARHLLSLHTARKRQELAQLEAVESGYEFLQVQPHLMADNVMPDVDWGVAWEHFLVEPYLSMFGPDV
ncbi:hypothetical protein FPHYL_2895 [Fusarium phyllophilum]|uniref:Zn(2)-C6 fungal-type domain-containing protein n=1 Tax=Fusarium phyllophilum TaxID=47803 RepID=A0A8H5K7J8_9HYPO|nr:hypothetical protein FPHYL_2895 [Fusarium phyllophilum]